MLTLNTRYRIYLRILIVANTNANTGAANAATAAATNMINTNATTITATRRQLLLRRLLLQLTEAWIGKFRFAQLWDEQKAAQRKSLFNSYV